MRNVIAAGILTLLAIGPWQTPARADGGVLRLIERHGAYQISVFTAPTPLRAGPVDISVLVQDADSKHPLTDVRVTVSLKPVEQQGTTIEATATSDAATNKLMQAALVELTAPGPWDVAVDCAGPHGQAQLNFRMQAGPRLPRWLAAWPWFSWPILAVLAFAISRSRKRIVTSHV